MVDELIGVGATPETLPMSEQPLAPPIRRRQSDRWEVLASTKAQRPWYKIHEAIDLLNLERKGGSNLRLRGLRSDSEPQVAKSEMQSDAA